MADVRCGDGAVLSVLPVPVLDRHQQPYEITLRLTLDGAPFGSVGERCGWFLAATAGRLAAVRSADENAFPEPAIEGGIRAWAVDEGRDPGAAVETLTRYLPRDRDLFAFRHRDPDDVESMGELRCSLRTHREFADGEWHVRQRAVLEAWGDGGRGVRATLTSGELAGFLRGLLAAAAELGCAYDLDEARLPLSRPAG